MVRRASTCGMALALLLGVALGSPADARAGSRPAIAQAEALLEEPMPVVLEEGTVPLLLGGLVGSAAGALAGGLAALPVLSRKQPTFEACLQFQKDLRSSSPEPKEDPSAPALCKWVADSYLYLGIIPVTSAEALGALVGILAVGQAQGRHGGWLGGSLGVVLGGASAYSLTQALLLLQVRALQQDLEESPGYQKPGGENRAELARSRVDRLKLQIFLLHGLLTAVLTTLLGTVGYYLTSGR